MSLAVEKKNKHLILNQAKLNLAKKILGARTETETIERALDSIISEAEKNKIAFQATERFLKSGIEIKDVFGNLENNDDGKIDEPKKFYQTKNKSPKPYSAPSATPFSRTNAPEIRLPFGETKKLF